MELCTSYNIYITNQFVVYFIREYVIMISSYMYVVPDVYEVDNYREYVSYMILIRE